LTVYSHGQFFNAFHLWGETRFQKHPPFSLTTFIGIGTKSDTHEVSRRRSRLFQDKTDASKPCRSSVATKMGAFDPWRSSYPSLHATSGHDLMHIPYEILGYRILGFFTPLDFKYPNVRSQNEPSRSTIGFSLILTARIISLRKLSHPLLNRCFPFLYDPTSI
jgi:hypothetical protein